MSVGTSGVTYFPWGPFDSTFWGGFWAPPPGVTVGIADITSESTLVAKPIDYSSISLNWEQPDENFDLYVIVRSSTGYPLTLTEGIITHLGQKTNNITSAVDGELSAGFYYYSMFIRLAAATPQWVRVSQAFALIATNNAAGQWFFELLPEWYQVEDEKTPGHPSNEMLSGWGQLRRYLEMLGRQFDLLRSEATSILDSYDARVARVDMLEYFSQMYGFPYEPHVGYAQLRALMANWFEMLKSKGTLGGIKMFVESLMGYSATVTLGADNLNYMLTLDDSEGREGIGRWQRDQTGRVEPADAATTLAQSTPAVPYTSTVTTAIRVTVGGANAGAIVNADLTSAATVMETAIPVTFNTTYEFQAALRAIESFSDTPKIYVYYYNTDGVFLHTDERVGTVYDENAWTVSSMEFTTPVDAATPQGDVGYVVLGLSSDPAAVKNFDVTGAMLSVSSGGPPAYEPARTIGIKMHPTRINYFDNPSYEQTGFADTYFNISSSSHYGYTVDSAALSFTTDIDVRVKLSRDDWTPSSIMTLEAKSDTTGDERSWVFSLLTDGKLRMVTSPDGTAGAEVTSDSTIPVTDAPHSFTADFNDIRYLKATVDVDNTAGGNDVEFYTSTDGSSWTQLGATVTNGGTTSINDSTARVTLLATENDGSVAGMTFVRLYYAEVRDGIDGTIVASPDWTDNPHFDAQGNTWVYAGATATFVPDLALHFLPEEVGVGAYFIKVTSEDSNPITSGSRSMKVTLAPGVTDVTVKTTLISPLPLGIVVPSFTAGDIWSFSFTIKAAQTPAGETVFPIFGLFLKDSSESTQSGIIPPANMGFGWTQMSVDVQIGADASFLPFVTAGITINDAASNGPSYYIDNVQLERNAYIYQYSFFDGNSDLTSADFLWSAGINDSPSMYFPNKLVRSARLGVLLPDFLPANSAYDLSYVLPTT